jgi:hypothetical protein
MRARRSNHSSRDVFCFNASTYRQSGGITQLFCMALQHVCVGPFAQSAHDIWSCILPDSMQFVDFPLSSSDISAEGAFCAHVAAVIMRKSLSTSTIHGLEAGCVAFAFMFGSPGFMLLLIHAFSMGPHPCPCMHTFPAHTLVQTRLNL